MNNKGFTLVELIATIALLAVISIISFVSINEVIDSSKISECNALVNSIKSATKEYVSDNRYNNDFNVTNINVNNLNLTSSLINPFTDEELTNNDVKITVILNDDYTAKKIIVKNSSNQEINCDNKKW